MERRSLLAAMAGLPLLAACGSSRGGASASIEDAAGSGRLSVGMIPVAHFAPVYIAQNEGFFADAGLEVTTQVMQSAAAIVPSVINGQIQIGTSAGSPFINVVANDLPVSGVAPAGANPATRQEDTIALLVTEGGPQSILDLEDATMATNAIGSQPHIAAAKILLDAGGDPEKLKPLSLPMPDALAALLQGRVDAAAIAEPFVTLGQEQGAKILTALYSEAFENTGAESLYFASRELIGLRREEIEAFHDAILLANEAANAEHSLLVDVLVKNLDMERGLAEKMVPPTFATDLQPETLQEISRAMTETGFLDEPVAADRLVMA